MTSRIGLGRGIPFLVIAALLVSCRSSVPPADIDEFSAAWRHRVEQPNIVLIVIDTLRRDRLGCYGHDPRISPNIDRLASSSVVFDNAYSQAPWTLPSMAALLTSRYPAELGIRGFNQRIPDSEIFLPEILSDHGYAAHAVVSHDFVGAKWGFDQGFDSFQSFAGGHRSISSERVTRAALPLIDSFAENPTFLLVHYFDPHFLYIEHDDFPADPSPPEADSQWWVMAFKKLRARARRGELSEEKRDYLLALYDSEISFTDRQIGRLLKRLEEANRRRDTIVILTADHGEEFLDHGGLGHTSTVYNELINVPLLIRWPGVDEPIRSDRAVALIDLLPTLLDYVGISLDHSVSGLHMRDRTPDKAIYSETRRYQRVLGMIKSGWKLVYDENRNRVQFFDLVADPGEIRGLPEIRDGSHLLRELSAYREHAARSLAGLEQGSKIEITPEERQRLEALGYVD